MTLSKGNHLKISTCSFYVSLAKDYLIQPDFMVNHDQKPSLIPVVQAMSHGFSPEKKHQPRLISRCGLLIYTLETATGGWEVGKCSLVMLLGDLDG
jgi:hypothetical protein